jgi:hypothetical protein
MTAIDEGLNRSTRAELRRVVEPLASYICATERPRSALRSALSVLFHEIAATHRAALNNSQRLGGSET